MKRHQKQLEKLREETDNYTKPFVDSSSDESDTPDVDKNIAHRNDSINLNPTAVLKTEKIETKEPKDDRSSQHDKSKVGEFRVRRLY